MSGTPVKILIAQEMSKDVKSERKPPTVVARLMGLDDDLTAQPCPAANQNKFQECLHQAYFAAHRGCHQQDIFINGAVPSETHQSDDQKKEKEHACKIWKKSTQKRGRSEGNQNEIKMLLVREKFVEAKRLATDGKLLHSKEFQDALDVLSSNRDLFLKFLQEPNSLFTKHISNLPFPASLQTKPITVLKSSKNVEAKFEKMVKEQEYLENDKNECGKKNYSYSSLNIMSEMFSQPTRIVVLKPSARKTTKLPNPSISPEYQVRQNRYGDQAETEALRSGYMVDRSARQMQKALIGHRRDEALLSSVFSNGHKEGSSFNLLEIDYNEEDDGFSDSEMDIVTQTSPQSLDRFGSPYSPSSFNKVSDLPESSVIREAKKQLSERWALMASNEMKEAQLHFPRNTTTLGEMLSILRTVNSGESSPRNLLKSKSVPVSSSAYNDVGLKTEDSISPISKSTVLEVSRAKHGKLSFRGKVSGFFFSRSKKANRERAVSSVLVGNQCADMETVRTYVMPKSTESCLASDNRANDEEQSIVSASPMSITNVSVKALLTLQQGKTCGKSSEQRKQFIPQQNFINNLDQPSPTSILDAPFEDDAIENLSQSSEIMSSPIESVARSLSWDDTQLEMLYPQPSSLHTFPTTEDADREYFASVQKLLSYAGFEDWDMIFTGWHSLDSPLDPVLLDNFIDGREKGSKNMGKRSNLRLLFDSVNSALLELSCNTLMSIQLHNRLCSEAQINAHACSLAEVVWATIRAWFSGNQANMSAETNSILVVDRTLRKEVGGNCWDKTAMIEVEEITKEVSVEMLEDLLSEALAM
ncbi:hypothetical protein ZIOFF_028000 [Zingiber officinale]|uniref:DUF3741 domain-containing protein n=1 Tax=Zingiber officinale TaxID=94328 RepID=A0A8J5GP29_ZINOF|nr:hypothetical protein ZIOFF_028000 [Zingiber officinale]